MKHRFESPLEQPAINRASASERFSLFVESSTNIHGVLGVNEYENSGNSGEIKVDTEPGKNTLMLVRTDTGALVNADRELATERLSGCAALFVTGPGINYLVHLTPSTNLGYYYYRHSNPEELAKGKAQKIIELLAQASNPLSCRGVIVSNEGNDSGGPYDKANIFQALTRLQDNLLEAGLGEVVIAEPLPMDETTLYYNPDEPEILFATGLAVDSQDPSSVEAKKLQTKISIQSGKHVS